MGFFYLSYVMCWFLYKSVLYSIKMHLNFFSRYSAFLGTIAVNLLTDLALR